MPSLGALAWRLLPARNALLYRASRRYVDRYRGEYISDIRRNGELDLLRRVLPTCRQVFDVGANVGDWARLALEINPVATIHCFEPSPTTFAALQRQAFPANVIRNNYGLSATPATAEMHIHADGSGLNSLCAREGLESRSIAKAGRTETIALSTLDTYCADQGVDHIDFLKIDVEGHELSVLQGATTLLGAGAVDLIQFEYGGCNIDARVFLKDLFDFLQPFGYRLMKIVAGGVRRYDRYDQQLDNFQYQNWAAILPRERVCSGPEV